MYDHSCGILTIPSTRERRLYVVGGYHGGWRSWAQVGGVV